MPIPSPVHYICCPLHQLPISTASSLPRLPWQLATDRVVVEHAEVVPDLVRHHEDGREAGAGVGLAAGVGDAELADHAVVLVAAHPAHPRQPHRHTVLDNGQDEERNSLQAILTLILSEIRHLVQYSIVLIPLSE